MGPGRNDLIVSNRVGKGGNPFFDNGCYIMSFAAPFGDGENGGTPIYYYYFF